MRGLQFALVILCLVVVIMAATVPVSIPYEVRTIQNFAAGDTATITPSAGGSLPDNSIFFLTMQCNIPKENYTLEMSLVPTAIVTYSTDPSGGMYL